jgi:hypothetical protein
MTTMTRLRKAALLTSVLAGLSFALCSQAGLAMVVDPSTGHSHCVPMLAGFLHVTPYGPVDTAAEVFSVSWALLIPLAVVLGAIDLALRCRARHSKGSH